MKKLSLISWIVLPVLMLALPVSSAEKPKRHPSTPGAKVYVVSPEDGAKVKKQFKVIFGLSGMGICPAGITVDGQPIPDTGHHHLMIDVDKLPPMDEPLPAEQHDKIKHYGKGQTEAMLELTPGKHTLQLIFADFAHVPHDPPILSKKITVIVE